LKYLLFTLLFIACCLKAVGQNPYQNEWIDYDLTYYKFESEQTAIHRISFETLSSLGISLKGDRFQLFAAGKQIPIYVTTNSTFGEGDFIAFYGSKNDGELDVFLYTEPAHQPNPNYSLFGNKRAYFLTSVAEGEHLRIQSTPNDFSGNLPPVEPYFHFRSHKDVVAAFHFGEPVAPNGYYSLLGDFTEGEGWAGSLIKSGFDYIERIPTPGLYPNAKAVGDAMVKFKLVGRGNAIGVIYDQQVEAQIGEKTYIKDEFSDFSLAEYQFPLKVTQINQVPDFTGQPRTTLRLKALDGSMFNFPFESEFSLVSASIRYPRVFDFEGKNTFFFELDLTNKKQLNIANFNHEENVVLYDLTDNSRQVGVVENDTVKFIVNANLGNLHHEYFLSNTSSAVTEITNLIPKVFIDYQAIATQGDFLIITNDSLGNHTENPIERYRDYRSSVAGGSHQVSVVYVDELYDQFAWGITQHSLAIQNFIRFAVEHWETRPDYLLLLGKSVSYHRNRTSTFNHATNLVPSYGHTPSDILLASDGSGDFRPLVAVSRISAQTPQQIHDYLDKLEVYESQQSGFDCETAERYWKKKVLHISKGWGMAQTEDFSSRLLDYTNHYQESEAGMYVVETLTDFFGPPPSGNPAPWSPSPGFGQNIEEGISLITYFGHGLIDTWQFDISENPSDYEVENRYPIVISAACSVGDIHKPAGGETMVERYVLSPQSGTIGFGASTALSSVFYIDLLTDTLIENMMIDHYGNSFAQNLRQSIIDLYKPNDINVRKVCTEYLIQGDPALTLNNWNRPEFELAVDTNFIEIDSLDYEETMEWKVLLYNLGKRIGEPITISVHQQQGAVPPKPIYEAEIPCPAFVDTILLNIPVGSNLFGENTFFISVNNRQETAEDCFENNTLSRQVYLRDCAPDCPEIILPDLPEPPEEVVQTNIEDPIIEGSIVVYPNPSQGNFTVKSQSTPIQSLSVYSLTGEAVLVFSNINHQQIEFNLKNYPKGVYTVEVLTNSKLIRKRISFL